MVKVHHKLRKPAAQRAALMKILHGKQFQPPHGAGDHCCKMAQRMWAVCAPQLRATAIRCRAQTARVWDHVGRTTHECASPIFPRLQLEETQCCRAWEPSGSHQPWSWSLNWEYFRFSTWGQFHLTFSVCTGFLGLCLKLYLFRESPLRVSDMCNWVRCNRSNKDQFPNTKS